MLGQLKFLDGQWGATRRETVYGLEVLTARTDPEGWLGESRLRRAGRRELPLLDTIPAPEPEERPVLSAVLALPPMDRAVIHLFYYEDYSVARIAEILHSREGTVKSQLNRGRQLLKTKLMEAWNDDE